MVMTTSAFINQNSVVYSCNVAASCRHAGFRTQKWTDYSDNSHRQRSRLGDSCGEGECRSVSRKNSRHRLQISILGKDFSAYFSNKVCQANSDRVIKKLQFSIKQNVKQSTT